MGKYDCVCVLVAVILDSMLQSKQLKYLERSIFPGAIAALVLDGNTMFREPSGRDYIHIVIVNGFLR